MKIKSSLFVLLIVVPLTGIQTSCYTISWGDRDFHFQDGELFRGKDKYIVRAFYIPNLLSLGTESKVMTPTFVKVAEVGGNTLAVDFYPSMQGDNIDQTWIETAKTYANIAKEQYMSMMFRIACPDKPSNNHPLVKMLKSQFKNLYTVLYWIEGPFREEWIQTMKKIDKNWIIVAEKQGDILIKNDPTNLSDTKKSIYTSLPNSQVTYTHILLSYAPEHLASLDQALEKETGCVAFSANNAPTDIGISETEKEEGFVPLFDGKTLNGWWYLGDNHNSFAVNPEGFIEWKSKGGKALMSCERYDNFILRLDWKIEKGGNSGVWLWAPRGGRASKIGFEIQMRGDSDATEINDDSSGAIYKVIPPKEKAVKPEGQWNSLEVTCLNSHVKVILNGKLIQDVNFDEVEELKYRLRKGFIGLTDHNSYCAFQNIRIKKL